MALIDKELEWCLWKLPFHKITFAEPDKIQEVMYSIVRQFMAALEERGLEIVRKS